MGFRILGFRIFGGTYFILLLLLFFFLLVLFKCLDISGLDDWLRLKVRILYFQPQIEKQAIFFPDCFGYKQIRPAFFRAKTN